MLAPDLVPIAIALLTASCISGLVVAVFYPHMTRDSESARRYAAIAARDPTIDGQTRAEESQRKRMIENALREIEDRKKIRQGSKPSLMSRIRQAGLSWTKSTYYMISAAAGVASLLIPHTAFGVGLLPGIGFGIAGGLLLPHLYVSAKRNARLRAFASEFPNAVDVIVRGVKAGLPLVDCLRIISTEAQEPVRSEFRTVLEDQTMGMPMDQAAYRLPERIPLPEANFFAIVIALQSRTGGSLSEALGNLSKVLRERKKMQAKIKAVSSEAKYSAGIIGSLPIIVGGLVYITSPDYISLLFTTFIGKFVLALCAFWMTIGALVMRKMINFDF
ncbi:type II secretion system F family protein [Microvirga sp. GCM10011540]|uniref:type II secretion system F family protein n=1 Tax=Microvirga sp. GCM10011540 TaxID=3317338 RepID=UPI00360F821F